MRKNIAMYKKAFVLFLPFLLLVLLTVSSTWNSVLSQDQPPSAESEQAKKLGVLREMLRALREEKKQLYDTRKNWKDEKKDLENRIKSLELRTEYGSKELKVIREENNLRRKENEEINGKIKSFGKDIESLKRIFLDEIESLIKIVQLGVPWKEQERISRLEDIKSKFKDDKFDLLEVIRKLWDFISEESAQIRSCEMESIQFSSGSGQKIVDGIRIGRLFVLYQSEDRKEVGILFKGKDGNLEKVELPARFQGQINNVILVLKRYKAPEIITVPVLQSLYNQK